MSSNRFVTIHILTTLGLHNLNRDGNGLPKSQFDGGVQRARLSSQSLKRGARILYREQGRNESLRTRLGAFEIARRALLLAKDREVKVDEAKVIDAAIVSIRSLYAGKEKTTPKVVAEQRKTIQALLADTAGKSEEAALAAAAEAAPEESAPDSGGADLATAKDTITFLSTAELDGFAAAIVDSMTAGFAVPDKIVKDAASDALDIAAFGRMFAEQQDVGTQGAVAVSHATTVHRMQLVADYFTAVEDVAKADKGAAHLSENYFTSGTYYRTFTVDIDQLARSWSGFGAPRARDAVTDMVRSLIYALPRGKVNSTNSSVIPRLVLAEVQNFRLAYSFDDPVPAGHGGGYTAGAVESLAAQRRQALKFDPTLFGEARVLGDSHGADFEAPPADNLADLVTFVVEKIYEDR